MTSAFRLFSTPLATRRFAAFRGTTAGPLLDGRRISELYQECGVAAEISSESDRATDSVMNSSADVHVERKRLIERMMGEEARGWRRSEMEGPQDDRRSEGSDSELSSPDNPELLRLLDRLLLELERRLYLYAKTGPELVHMADEGLILASRAKARLGQAISAAEHAESHLQVVGVGEWAPSKTRPGWGDDPRVTESR